MSRFNNLNDDFFPLFFPSFPKVTSKMAMNACKDDEGVTLEFAVPGCKKEDIKIEMVKHNILKVSVTKREEKKYDVSEFTSVSECERMVALDGEFDIENSVANVEDGILSIRLVYDKSKKEAKTIKIA